MLNRTVDQLIVCLTFGVCKLRCEIPFANIIESYYRIVYGSSQMDEY